ncbi:hypothetical protein FPOAC2_09311 [Fusarium poae]
MSSLFGVATTFALFIEKSRPLGRLWNTDKQRTLDLQSITRWFSHLCSTIEAVYFRSFCSSISTNPIKPNETESQEPSFGSVTPASGHLCAHCVNTTIVRRIQHPDFLNLAHVGLSVSALLHSAPSLTS